jgi:hypothetical protein
MEEQLGVYPNFIGTKRVMGLYRKYSKPGKVWD